jgi:hypothetical protein
VDTIGGPKAGKRHEDIRRWEVSQQLARKRMNMVKFKPHEAQKYKKGVLKFGRATISIEGSEWVRANPPLMYAMKHSIEKPITITSIPNPGAGPCTRIEMDGRVQYSTVPVAYQLWYRGVLSDTNLPELERVHRQMIEWCSMGPLRMAACGHGDDIDIVRSDAQGVLYAEEADIKDNDGSYTDSMLRLEAHQLAVHHDCVDVYAQLANPLLLINPCNENEKILLRSKLGMLRCSGGIGTTYGNTKGGFLVILAYAASLATDDLRGVPMAAGAVTIAAAAASVGFNVTSDVFDLAQSTFLSKFRYWVPECKGEPGAWKVMSCLASFARGFGRVTGDLGGSSRTPVCNRWLAHVEGVVRGYVHEPDCLFWASIRSKYDTSMGQSMRDVWRKWTSMGHRDELGAADWGIVRHYYESHEEELGVYEYLYCIQLIKESPKFGSVIACGFIDRLMSKRYGMAPVL